MNEVLSGHLGGVGAAIDEVDHVAPHLTTVEVTVKQVGGSEEGDAHRPRWGTTGGTVGSLGQTLHLTRQVLHGWPAQATGLGRRVKVGEEDFALDGSDHRIQFSDTLATLVEQFLG